MNLSKYSLTVLGQLFKLIPRNLIPKLAKEYGVSKKSRSFSPTSHVLALMFGQLSHSISLNDICDPLHNHIGALTGIRGAVAPSKNAMSNAKGVRNAGMAQALFWSVFNELQNMSEFWHVWTWLLWYSSPLERAINIVDSSTIRLQISLDITKMQCIGRYGLHCWFTYCFAYAAVYGSTRCPLELPGSL